MLKRLFQNFVLKGTDWLFRARSIELLVLKLAFGVLIVIFGGPPLVAMILLIILGAVPESYLAAQKTLSAVDVWILAICSIVILVSLVMIILRVSRDTKSRSKKRIVVIEGRGLRDDDGSPLDQFISGKVEGQIIPVLLDLRNRLDGKIIEPERALEDILAAHRSVLQHQKNVERSELSTVYGGMTSVPYTFLTGILIDDESSVSTYDWDRAQESWRSLDMLDDGMAFKVSGIENLTNAAEVVIALAFSYPIDSDDLHNTFSCPVVRLTLDGLSSDAHWSQKKQNRLAQEFFEAVKQLNAVGVKRIHLVMAAPNSAVFTFGRRYDKRNLPELVVYQYERGNDPAYPWGILMPVAGIERPQVKYS
mgnify:CR=1 FL=1